MADDTVYIAVGPDHPGYPDVAGDTVCPGERLPLTAFNKCTRTRDADTEVKRYQMLAGYDITTGQYSPWAGLVDYVPDDKRMVMGCGPFELAPGEVDSFKIGLCFSNGATGGLDYLKSQADSILGRTGIGESTPTPPPGIGLSVSPNPFKGFTVIHYELSSRARVAIQIYDGSGRLIKMLVPELQRSGPNSIIWAGRDKLGNRVPPGVYFIRLEAGGYSATRKLILLR